VFGLGAATRIYLAPGATDMRKGFNGLYGLVWSARPFLYQFW
jgi:transposase